MRKAIVCFTIDANEKSLLSQLAERENKSLSQYVREIVLDRMIEELNEN
ncbi:hypothetical protein [Deltalipothrixvirus pozzuoliense]|uniref:Uncharacterized protein ORF48 n=1 Tax=Acidianus filamentous virus 2 (isolate Italy/Pozzuoli) TaxID=654910 RepID=Y048_AFV2P|nr:hypothetical protein AFV2_gp13 [Acidianus filamentous virus 2]Q573F6.1 RecName: Full=Uncharacterized protein ORF48 [Acidianus filamentous virus 2 (isolate Pozzuoli)]CAH69400.1 hypothetical protein [Acidianus filamentous virus 2]